jgi:DNA-directed RNA polymerase subunit RPC12/RpoP
MISSVARWRCSSCSASLKAITETDQVEITDRVRLELTCPNCSETQLLYADRLVEVTVETSDAA